MRGGEVSRRIIIPLSILIVLVAAIAFAARFVWETPTTAEAQPAELDLQEVRVTGVVDGDTIDVSPPVEGLERVRLIGVDTPEVSGREEPCGPEASAFTTEQLEGEQVGLELDEDRTDQYGRALAYVWLGDELFNETLVREGYARVATFAPNDKYEQRFLGAQREARAAGVNLWDPAAPCAASEPASEPTTATTAPAPAPNPAPTRPAPEQTPSAPGRGELMEAGGSKAGPVPLMPGGACPKLFPVKKNAACYPN